MRAPQLACEQRQPAAYQQSSERAIGLAGGPDEQRQAGGTRSSRPRMRSISIVQRCQIGALLELGSALHF